MNKASSISLLTTTAFLLAGCETPTATMAAPADATRDQFLAAGASPIDTPNLMNDGRASIVFPGGTVTYTDDGGKLWVTRDGSETLRRWFTRADGVICEEGVRDGAVNCSDGSNPRLLQLDDDVRLFSTEGELEFLIRRTGSSDFVAQSA